MKSSTSSSMKKGQEQLQTLKKAYPIVKSYVEDMLMNIGTKLDELQTTQEQLEKKKYEFEENTNSIKQTIHYSFEELRQRLAKKEHSMLMNAEHSLQKMIKDVDGVIKSILDKMESIKSTADIIQNQVDTLDSVILIN